MKNLHHLAQSPEITLNQLSGVQGDFWVVRDDMLEGGTKERGILPYLQELHSRGYTDFVYASPFCGYAQVALGAACKQLGLSSTLFCAEDAKTPGERQPHAYTQKAQALGSSTHIVPTLDEAINKAHQYVSSSKNTYLLPLGFDCDRFRLYLSQQLAIQYQHICHKIGKPTNVWVPVGSGTLASTFYHILPSDIQLQCVNVRVLDYTDARIRRIQNLPRVQLWTSPEQFEEIAQNQPPIPSNDYYDAKVWRFTMLHAQPGDVWWNVGP